MSESDRLAGWLRPYRLRALLLRLLAGGLAWLALTEAAPGAWRYGLPIVVGVVLLSLYLLPPRRRPPAPLRVLLLTPILFWYSLLGGIDVALRVLRRRPRLDPGFIEIPLERPDGAEAIVLAYVLTLLPGSLVTAVERDRLCLHVIDLQLPTAELTRRVERYLRWALAPGEGA